MSDITVQAHEVSPGVVSMMRKLLPGVIRMGWFLSGSGVALAFGMLLLDRYALVPVSVALVAAGPSLASTALAWKAWQAQAEKES